MARQKLLIEIGAYDGGDSLRYYEQGFRVITFEPNIELYNQLVEKTKSMEGYDVYNHAVCLEDGETTFYICRRGGASSILPFKSDEELAQHWTWNRTDIQYSGTSYTVPTTRLDTFIEKHHLESTVIDYLHCDAQGVDLDVLKSLGKYVHLVKEGVIESAFKPEKSIYQHQDNTLETATRWLEEHGFQVTDVSSNDYTGCECNIQFKRVQN